MTAPETPPTGDDAPLCAAPLADVRSPVARMSDGACDAHMHICGPAHAYSYDPARIYTPPDALVPDYVELIRALGISRTVVVQPSVYGTDNRVMLNAMRDLANAGHPTRAVAVVDYDISDAELDALDAAGVRGLRFNLVDVADPGRGLPIDDIRGIASRIQPRGWHVEFLVHVDDYPEFDVMFEDFPTDVVVGHTGYVRVGRTTEDPGFQAMLRLASAGKCWIKLTAPYRISALDMPYPEAGDFTRAAVAAAPARIVWGTDWPHVRISKPMPHDADLCDRFFEWVPDTATRRRILVDNPTELYSF